MTLRSLKTASLLALLALIGVGLRPATAVADDGILFVEQVSGSAGVQRDGKRLVLASGDALQEQDLIVTQAGGRVTLRLGRHGFIDIGSDAEVGVERLPFAAFARDLKSIFSISRGYLRVVWKYPQTATNWPLFVYMSGHRISLVSGEYFFQSRGNSQRACVAAGQIALQTASAEGVETLRPPSCAVLKTGEPMQVTARNPDDWFAIRRGLDLESAVIAQVTREPPSVPAAVPPAATPFEPAAAGAAGRALGPVAAAPVLPEPLSAPRTALAPALPESQPPLLQAATPVRIGEVQAAPLALPPLAPASAAKPTPAPAAPVAPPANGGSWALNVASYPEASSAEQQAARLREAGYRAATASATVNGKLWHRVQVGGYASREAAKAAADELGSRFKLANIWVLKP